MKTEILKMLKDKEGYVSGQEICEVLGVSRTAVWKGINRLKEDGYEIEAVRNKGYKLGYAQSVFSAEEITTRLNTKWLGKKILYKKEMDSTNTQAKLLADKNDAHGMLIIADKQTNGKGRRGRHWDSPSEDNIYMSIVLKPELNPSVAPMLTLLMAFCITSVIREELRIDAKIKWPNDVVVSGKKVCGILTEMVAEIDYINYVVIGSGINVNMENISKELSTKATSLKLELKKHCDRVKLTAKIIEEFEKQYELFLKKENLEEIVEQYNVWLVNADEEVAIHRDNKVVKAYAKGIIKSGELMVIHESGEEEFIASGEVSIRGIYGYV